MAEKVITQNNWTGGISNDDKLGPPNSYRFSRNINIFEDANYVTLYPKTELLSDSVITDLPVWGVNGAPFDANHYYYDIGGGLYKETIIGSVFNQLFVVPDSQGQGLNVFSDYLYYAGEISLGRYGTLSSSVPVNYPNFLVDGTTNLDQSQSLSGNTYTPPVAISEVATNLLAFTPERDPIASIELFVVSKGTGDWTITVHDSANNVLGTATVANASLVNGALNSFAFPDLIQVQIGVQYHFHVTSTVADGTLRTGTASDLSTATYNEFFSILVPAQWHPMTNLLNGMVIGNGSYLAFWDQATYNPNRVALESGYEVIALTYENEFVVALARGADGGKLFYWDGIEDTFNYSKPIKLGRPQAITTSKNRLVGLYGSFGEIFLGSDPFELLHELPKLPRANSVEFNPGAITEYQTQVAFGVSFDTDDTTAVDQGVYVWGNRSDAFPEAYVMGYTLSTGNLQGVDQKIGVVQAFPGALMIGWRDPQASPQYGIDRVVITNDPFEEGELYSLIFDDGNPQKPKYVNMIVIEFEPLQPFESVTPKYAIDTNAFTNTFTLGDTVSTTGATKAVFPIGKRFYNFSFGFNVTAGNTYPKITAMHLVYDPLEKERSF